MRLANDTEDPSTSLFLLPATRGVNTPKMPKLRALSADHGILASNVKPGQLKCEGQPLDVHDGTGSSAAASGEKQRPKGGPPKHSAPRNVHATDTMVTQIWGLEHSVEPSVHRVIAMTANKGHSSLVLGSRIMGEFAKMKFKPTGSRTAQVRSSVTRCTAMQHHKGDFILSVDRVGGRFHSLSCF